MKCLKNLGLAIAALLLVAGLIYASTYTGTDPEDLDTSTPTEGNSPPSEINDSIREIKTVFKNQQGVRWVNSAYTATSSDSTILCNGVTITLPAVDTVSSASILKKYEIVMVNSTGTCTVDGNGSETINGGLTASISGVYNGLSIIGNATAWYGGYISNALTTVNADTLDGYHGSAPNTNTPNTYAIWNASGYLPMPFRGALVTNGAETIPSAGGVLHFSTETFDTDGFHSTVTNTSRFTIPDGISYVEVSGCAGLTDGTTDLDISIYKNNSMFLRGTGAQGAGAGASITVMCVPGVIVPTVSGDYIELYAHIVGSTGIGGGSGDLWFQLKVLR